jgi:tetratricopeptide (TPR) repeat protein
MSTQEKNKQKYGNYHNNSMYKTWSQKALHLLFFVMGLGCLFIILYSFQPEIGKLGARLKIISVGLMVAGASLLFGGLLGFLFGIPRTLQYDNPSHDEIEKGSRTSDSNLKNEERNITYKANTNLEQISDWLTKIIVGVGLTQIPSIKQTIKSIIKYFAEGMGNYEYNRAFVFAVLIFFISCGFLFGYLWTRLFMAYALREADESILGIIQNRMNRVDEQQDHDTRAMSIFYSQIYPSIETPAPTVDDLYERFKHASRQLKIQIFNQAKKIRKEGWKEIYKLNMNSPNFFDESKVVDMEKIIPVFRALIKCDTKSMYHRNYGQLGYALKDKRDPDFNEAIECFNKAIEIREKRKLKGWLLYEFNRAYSRISIDEDFKNNKPTDHEVRDLIYEDLNIAGKNQHLKSICDSDAVISKWVGLNPLKV